jgi:hypothetical protein
MISTILNFKVFHLDDPLQQASLAMAIINLLFYAAVNILFGIFIIRIQDAVGFLWLHKHFACVYDGFNMRTILGKAYILIPYIQKWSIAIVLVISEDPTIQVHIHRYSLGFSDNGFESAASVTISEIQSFQQSFSCLP